MIDVLSLIVCESDEVVFIDEYMDNIVDAIESDELYLWLTSSSSNSC